MRSLVTAGSGSCIKSVAHETQMPRLGPQQTAGVAGVMCPSVLQGLMVIALTWWNPHSRMMV